MSNNLIPYNILLHYFPTLFQLNTLTEKLILSEHNRFAEQNNIS